MAKETNQLETLTLGKLYESLRGRQPEDPIQGMSMFHLGYYWTTEEAVPQKGDTVIEQSDRRSGKNFSIMKLKPEMLQDCNFIWFCNGDVPTRDLCFVLEPCIAQYGHILVAQDGRRMLDHGSGARFSLKIDTDDVIFMNAPKQAAETAAAMKRIADVARQMFASGVSPENIYKAVFATMSASCIVELFVIGNRLFTGAEFDNVFNYKIPADEYGKLFRTFSTLAGAAHHAGGSFMRRKIPCEPTNRKQLYIHVAEDGLTVEDLKAAYLKPPKSQRLLDKIKARRAPCEVTDLAHATCALAIDP